MCATAYNLPAGDLDHDRTRSDLRFSQGRRSSVVRQPILKSGALSVVLLFYAVLIFVYFHRTVVPRNVMRLLAVSIALTVFALGASGAEVQRFATPEALVTRLRQEGKGSPLAQALRIWSCGNDTFTCADVSIRVLHPRLDPTMETAALRIEQTQFYADLVVLGRDTDGTWIWLDTLPLRFAYEPLKVEFMALVAPPIEDIVVHNNTETQGSGIYMGHFLIVRLTDRRLRVVFAATEKDYANPPGPGQVLRETTASFRLEPAGKGGAVISQTSQYKIGAASHTIVRTFTWNDRLGAFLPNIGDDIR